MGVAVVTSAESTAACDHDGCTDLTYAAAPVTCGHDMDVPEMMLYLTLRSSTSSPDSDAMGDHAARMSTPGALMSGLSTPAYEKAVVLSSYWVLYMTAPSAPVLYMADELTVHGETLLTVPRMGPLLPAETEVTTPRFMAWKAPTERGSSG
nr:unnamed protein product [Digitaria exilis]